MTVAEKLTKRIENPEPMLKLLDESIRLLREGLPIATSAEVLCSRMRW